MTVDKPWGEYLNLLETSYCKVKKITIKTRQRLSYQYHHNRNEIWAIVSGRGEVTLDEQESLVEVGDVVEVSVGCKHRIKNAHDYDDLVLIEV